MQAILKKYIFRKYIPFFRSFSVIIFFSSFAPIIPNLYSQNSLRLTANGQMVNCGDLDVTGTQLTVEAKVYSVSGASVNIISKHTGPGNCNYLLRMGSIELATTNGFTTLASPIPVSPNQCYHIAATYDGATIRYFVNGCETASKPWSGNLVTNNYAMCIGNQSNCQCEQFFGYIDEARVWNVVRTQGQIEANMDVLPSPTTQLGLRGYYDFEMGYTNVQGNATFNGNPIGASMAANPSCPLTIGLFSITVSSTPVSCGAGGGTITVATTGGIAPYDYSIDGVNFQANPVFTNVPAGNYTVTSRSANGCVRTASATITDPGPIVINSSQTDVSCNGAFTGKINLVLSGGTIPYTITWTPAGNSGLNLLGLPAGNYSVTVSDPLGCSQTQAFQILEPAAASATISGVQHISCFGANDGSATVNTLGGIAPYTYLWDNGEQTQTAVLLTPGSHGVVVRDNNLCSFSPANITINEPTQLQGSVTVTQDVLCFGAATGEANIAVSGGTPNYIATWPSGSTALAQTGLAAGAGIVNITDANGCTATANYSVTQPPTVVSVSVSLNNHVSCNGGSDGSATANPAGGVGAFTYAWSNAFSGPSPTNLSAGNATVFVADGNGCTSNSAIVITEPLALSASITVDNPVGCAGGSDGQATANPSGGTSPFTYLWNSGETNLSAINLSAGAISVDVTDSKGCQTTGTGIMTEPAGITVTVSNIIDITCNGLTDGSANANGVGGSPPYTYLWDNNETAQTATSLAVSATHTVGISDQNGCTILSAPFTVTEPAAISIALASQTNITCFGANDGMAQIIVTGGTSPYQYLWPNATTTNPTIGLSPGLQTVTVTDNNLCQETFNVTITQPLQLAVTVTLIKDISCFGANDGSASTTVTGGIPPFTYLWSNGETNDLATALPPSQSTVAVTDANNCSVTSSSVTIAEPVLLTGTIAIVNNVSCFGLSDGSGTVTPAGGTSPYSYLWDNGENLQTALNLSVGNPIVEITDANGCTEQATVAITEPPIIDFTITGTSTICIGQNATLTAIAAAGQPALIFNWNNNFIGASQNVSPTTTTSYSVIASSAPCISAPQTVTVTVNPPITLSAFDDTSICEGDTVSIFATGSGGDGTLTYTWDNALPTNAGPHSVTPVATTVYNVTLSDGCGTPTVSAVVNITVHPYPVISFTNTNADSCVPLVVDFTSMAAVSSGEDMNHFWIVGGTSSGDSLSRFTFDTPGSYHVQLTVTSAFGCTAIDTQFNYITVHPNPVAIFTPDPNFSDEFNTQIYMANNSVGATTYNWTYKDSVYTAFDPLINVPDTGLNYIFMEAITEFGCHDTTIGSVYISPMFAFYIPGAFTVNGDFVNEVFSPQGVGFSQYEMKIFNRWGQEMYRTKDIEKGWNGKLSGTDEVVKQDYYTYDIALTLLNGAPRYYKGKFCLVK